MYEPYLILEAATDEALSVAEKTAQEWMWTAMRRFAESEDD